VLETSPRLDERYRSAMSSWFDYLSSDFDERAHKGAIRVDLQDIDLPDRSLDVVLTPHVLEHVPDTDRALAELHRVLAPGGTVFLQVPLLQSRTAPPTEPEFHGDDTPVFWRFGWDLTDRLRAHGFEVSTLVPESLATAAGGSWPPPHSPEFDVDDIVAAAPAHELEVVADDDASHGQGFRPGYMFVTWRARRRT
jgi:SAM-dependent methyltransferase